ncbi:MAG: M48 family metalloprotease [Rhodospirillales bacterium]
MTVPVRRFIRFIRPVGVLAAGVLTAGLLALASVFAPGAALAQGGINLVRDTETEALIRGISDPLFEAAELTPENVRIFLNGDKSLNAFVMGGQNMFINLGLLTEAESVEEVIGVIAHETGHIAGGHLIRGQQAMRDAHKQSLLTAILGLGAGIVSGRADVGGAIMAGGMSSAQRTFLSFNRTQESAADRSAFRYLEATGQSARGLRRIMERLHGQEVLSTAQQDPYMRTHPLSDERIESADLHLEESAYTDAPAPEAVQTAFLRVRAKAFGYTLGWRRTIKEYPPEDVSAPARYARAHAAWRKPDIKRALAEAEALNADYPGDGYFLEFLGQIRFQSGDEEGALAAYKQSADILPDQPLILKELARVQIAAGGMDDLLGAVHNLRVSLRAERKNADTWGMLSEAYARTGDQPRSELARAEYAALIGDWEIAMFSAQRAETAFPEGSPEWLQAQDILAGAERVLGKKDE